MPPPPQILPATNKVVDFPVLEPPTILNPPFSIEDISSNTGARAKQTENTERVFPLIRGHIASFQSLVLPDV
jgi:hypothetical protein